MMAHGLEFSVNVTAAAVQRPRYCLFSWPPSRLTLTPQTHTQGVQTWTPTPPTPRRCRCCCCRWCSPGFRGLGFFCLTLPNPNPSSPAATALSVGRESCSTIASAMVGATPNMRLTMNPGAAARHRTHTHTCARGFGQPIAQSHILACCPYPTSVTLRAFSPCACYKAWAVDSRHKVPRNTLLPGLPPSPLTTYNLRTHAQPQTQSPSYTHLLRGAPCLLCLQCPARAVGAWAAPHP